MVFFNHHKKDTAYLKEYAYDVDIFLKSRDAKSQNIR